MADPTEREAAQAELLDAYWSALAADPRAAPPPELDPKLAALVSLLERGLRPPEPAAGAATRIRKRLLIQAVGLTARPALGGATPAAGTSGREPGPRWHRRPWLALAAACLAVVAGGVLLWGARSPQESGIGSLAANRPRSELAPPAMAPVAPPAPAPAPMPAPAAAPAAPPGFGGASTASSPGAVQFQGMVLQRGEPDGVVIAEVAPGSPAARAGLAAGDALVRIDGQDVLGVSNALSRLQSVPPGKEITLAIRRNGAERNVTLTAGAEQP